MGHKAFRIFCMAYLLGLTGASPLFSAQVLVMNEQERLTGIVSSKDLNRLQVVGERIASVFGSQGAFSLEHEEVKGQVFLKVHEGAPSRLDVSVVTESGLTQDLILKVTKSEGQTLLLKPLKVSSETWGETSGEIFQSLEMLKAMATSTLEGGYARKRVRESLPVWRDMDVTLVETWTGEGLEGRVYQVRNKGETIKILHEKHFRFFPKTVAISLDRFRLLPGGVAKAYVIVRASHA